MIKILAIIPARGGSKGLPRKNIRDLAGKPLIAWTIEAALNSKYITKTIVSSEDEEILEISKSYGADTVRRPDDLARDAATSESVASHAIDYLESMGEVFDITVLLQPTSPLRTSTDIDNAFDIMFYSDATAIISVCEFDNKALKTFIKDEDGFLQGISNNKYPFMRRQDLPSVYTPNGAIYIINTKIYLESHSFLTATTKEYLMPESRSIDIDTIKDLDFLNLIFQHED